MTVEELRKLLEAMPSDAWVDVMFPNYADAYNVVGVELLELSGGRQIVVIDITDTTPLKAV